MHGHKKTVGEPSPEELAATKKKKTTYQTMVTILFDRRDKRDFSPETFDLTTKMLLSNPDCYSIWNIRKTILLNNLGSIGLTELVPAKDDRIKADIGAHTRDQELTLSADCIKRNPKSCKRVTFSQVVHWTLILAL